MLRINEHLSVHENVLVVDRSLLEGLVEGEALGLALSGPEAYALVTAISLHFVGKPVESTEPVSDLCGTGDNACAPNCCGGSA